MSSQIKIERFFDSRTSTFSYVLYDQNTKLAAIIDPVLDYDQYSGKIWHESANQIIDFVGANNLAVSWILETHIHADHLTSASYIKSKIGGRIAIGSSIIKVIEYWSPIFDINFTKDSFELLLENNTEIELGESKIKILHTPGHTPACSTYICEGNAFVGDTIFMPDIGTALTDFPGGDAKTLYESIQKIFSLGDDVVLYVGHDYPPNSARIEKDCVTVSEQKEKNVLINSKISCQEYVKERNKRDAKKKVPQLLLPSIQFNLAAGDLNSFKHENGAIYLHIPIHTQTQ